ncbi:MAG: hypothetical protein FIA82_10055 [Melioribacter sp.]|nr:hypothetical protein [Melioribacter sp.]
MKVLMILLLIVPFGLSSAQKIGELAPERPPEIFPNNAWGVDVMFTEGGFGLGTFLRKSLAVDLTGFVDFSISETKDEREVTYIDYFGNSYTPDKVNRSFQLPLNFGVQYRMFSESLTDNLRPYLAAGIGPTLIITTPYDKEFFNAFGSAQTKYAIGGYVGFGANMGTSKSNLIGLNVRYYYTYVFGDGIENITNVFRKNFGQFALTLTVGIMY